MPTIIMHFPSEFVSGENVEDLLIQINKGIEKEADKYKSINAWMRAILRNYSLVAKQSRDNWKITGNVAIGGKQEKFEKPKFWDGATMKSLEDKYDGIAVSIPIGELQAKWLIDALVWENTLQIKFAPEGRKPRLEESVADLCRQQVLGVLMSAQVMVDMEKLKQEEDSLDEAIDE